MTRRAIAFVCPACKGPLVSHPDRHACERCRREYPIVAGIPDFRLQPDPYIGIEDDRRKGEALLRAGEGHTFEWLVRHYYAITPEDPADLAERWTARALNEVAIAGAALRDADLIPARHDGPLLDVGCSTGGLLIAASRAYETLVGVDVAFRWLAIGQARLRDARVGATLVCANAEHLPFPDRTFAAVTAVDVIEHVRDARAAFTETARVAAPGATLLATANNRYAPLPEPNVHLWGVGYLPRRLQARYVAARRGDLHPYRIRLSSARELTRTARDAGWTSVRATPARVWAPHVTNGMLAGAIAIYNRAAAVPIIAPLLTVAGPRLRLLAVSSTASPPPSP